MTHKNPPASEKIATGTSPDGRAVFYYEAERPNTISPDGRNGGMLILVVDAETGEKITHSDNFGGLVKAGFEVDSPPAIPDTPAADEEQQASAAAGDAGQAQVDETKTEVLPAPHARTPSGPKGARYGEEPRLNAKLLDPE